MEVFTTCKFNAPPEKLWPLFTHSKMDDKEPCYFLCGLPKPLECRLAGTGGVGGTRECISDKGTISQTILEWEPGSRLSFELKQTDIYFGPFMRSIVETFEIHKINELHTQVSRRTQFRIRAPYGILFTLPVMIGLKTIHHYVFNNWKRLAS